MLLSVLCTTHIAKTGYNHNEDQDMAVCHVAQEISINNSIIFYQIDTKFVVKGTAY